MELRHGVGGRYELIKKCMFLGELFGRVLDTLKMLVVLTVEVVDRRWDEEFDFDGWRRKWDFFGGEDVESGLKLLGKVGLVLMAWCFPVVLH